MEENGRTRRNNEGRWKKLKMNKTEKCEKGRNTGEMEENGKKEEMMKEDGRNKEERRKKMREKK